MHMHEGVLQRERELISPFSDTRPGNVAFINRDEEKKLLLSAFVTAKNFSLSSCWEFPFFYFFFNP